MFSYKNKNQLLIVLLLILIQTNISYTKPTETVDLAIDEVDDEASKEQQQQEQHIETEIENEIKINEVNLDDDVNEYRINYAKEMLTYMNLSVDPCDDFYEFACGNWKNTIQKRQTQHRRNNLLDINYRLLADIDKILQSSNIDSIGKEYENEFKLAQQYYNGCLNADLSSNRTSSEYLEVINNIGGFPAINKTWNPDNFSWFNMSAHLTNYGVASFINEQIIPQYPFPPYFKMPDIGFGYFVHTDTLATNTSKGYTMNEQQMRKYLTMYGVEEPEITGIIDEIFSFWKAVLNVTDQYEEDPYQCIAMSENMTFANWSNFFDIAWAGKDFNLTNDDCPCDLYYIELDKICEQNKAAVANYLAMKFLYDMDAKLESAEQQRDYCVKSVKNTMPYIIDIPYLKAHFNNQIYEEVSTIIKELRKTLHAGLSEADWLDESTRAEALLKESTITSRIGFVEDKPMLERLIREANNLTFVEGNYFQNNINLRKFKTYMKRHNGLHSDIFDNSTKPLELLVAAQVQGFYYNIDNSINMMAGLFNPPAYHSAWPNALKYGTLGFLIGHEFTHGFDSVGANFDGNLEERYWWSEKSGTEFEQRLNCYINHFNSYLIPEINRKVNGNGTIDENVADSGGLRSSLNAYRNFMKAQNYAEVLKNEQMPGLDLSPEQLFFVGFAQVWCAAYEEEHYWQELADEHTMDKYRVLGAVTNFDEFGKVYNCPVGAKMNPEKKCRLW